MQWFLSYDTKSTSGKRKIKLNWTLIEFKKICTAEEHHQKESEKNAQNWRKYLQIIYIPYPEYIKKLSQIINKGQLN